MTTPNDWTPDDEAMAAEVHLRYCPACQESPDTGHILEDDRVVVRWHKEKTAALRKDLTKSQATCALLRSELSDPPPDVQELVIKKLNLVSGEGCVVLKNKLAEAEKVMEGMAGAIMRMACSCALGECKRCAALADYKKWKEGR